MRAQPDDENEQVSASTIQSVDRALTILDLLAGAGGELGITELGHSLGVHKSTASRLIATLRAHDLVEQIDETGKYRLGIGLMRLSRSANQGLELVQLARPAMRRLSAATEEAIHLAVPSGHDALYVDQLTAASQLQANTWLGQRTPMHATAVGKALLAWPEDPDLLEEVCRAPLPHLATRTITQAPLLRREIALVRKQGWAATVDELEDGLTAFAAPVFGAEGTAVASISVSGPGVRLLESQEEFVAAVRKAAAAVSHRLGYAGDQS
ncbi:IclR family transcriptional regulator [Actinomycetota bacterium]